MRIQQLLAGAAVALVTTLAAASANAAIVNGSFETGDMTGWSGGFASTGYGATDGIWAGTIFAGCGAGVYCTISQTFSTTGGLFEGDANFLAHDYMPFNDDAFVSISAGPTTLFFSSIGAVGDYGSSGWTHFTKTLSAGSYTVTAGVRNNGDNSFNSQIVVDNFKISGSGAVPEPATWALMLSGFFGAGSMLRRRRQAVLAA